MPSIDTSHTDISREYSDGTLPLALIRCAASPSVIFSAETLDGATWEPLISGGMDMDAISMAISIASCWSISLLPTSDAPAHAENEKTIRHEKRHCHISVLRMQNTPSCSTLLVVLTDHSRPTRVYADRIICFGRSVSNPKWFRILYG